MNLAYENFRGFSNPYEPSVDELFLDLACGYIGATRNRLEKQIQALDPKERYLDLITATKPYIGNLDEQARNFGPEFSQAMTQAETEDFGNSVAQFLLGLHEIGFEHDWQLDNLAPAYLCFAGYSFISSRYLRVESKPQLLIIETKGTEEHRQIKFAFVDGSWTMAGAETRPMVRVLDRQVPVLVGTFAQPTHLWFGPTDVPSTGRPQEVVEKIQKGIDLMLEKVPEYGPWVERTLRRLTIAEGLEDVQDFSWSRNSMRGMVWLSYPCPLLSVPEALVHECAHQHYHMLQLLGPMDNGDDEEMYVSPVKLNQRSIERILVAFHAIANICLFYNRLIPNISDQKTIEAARWRLNKYTKMLPSMLKYLRETKGLTERGRAIWEPLSEQLLKNNLG